MITPLKSILQKELIWMEKFKHNILTKIEIIPSMPIYPILIETSIVINGDKAVVATKVKKSWISFNKALWTAV